MPGMRGCVEKVRNLFVTRDSLPGAGLEGYRGTSLIRKSPLQGLVTYRVGVLQG